MSILKRLKLPTVTDGFAGVAPDRGALELGAALPHDRPRLSHHDLGKQARVVLAQTPSHR
jgi:hypothetical protein